MTTKVLICPYFGDLPEWMDLYWENAERLKDYGYDFLLDDDEDAFQDRVLDKLGIEPPPMWGTGNIWDFRPALGYLYQDEIADFDWWGHTDFDCVYGRVEMFTTEARLTNCDIFTDCAHGYIAGPWTLYRNDSHIRSLFLHDLSWKANMFALNPTGWAESSFTDLVRSETRFCCVNEHGYDRPELLRWDGDRLMHGDREIPMFHFRRSKKWPL